MQNFFNQIYLGNSITAYLTALGIFIIGILLIKVFKSVVLKQLKKWAENTETTLDDFLVKGIERTIVPLLYFLSFYLAVKSLNLDKKVEKYFDIISIVIFTFFILRTLSSVITYSLKTFVRKRGTDEQKQRQLKGILTIISFVIGAWGLFLCWIISASKFQQLLQGLESAVLQSL